MRVPSVLLILFAINLAACQVHYQIVRSYTDGDCKTPLEGFVVFGVHERKFELKKKDTI
jgi:hypothetical protein